LIIVLVLGPQDWSLYHYGGLLGAPLLIYGVRKTITLFFDWRIGRQQSHLTSLQMQREQKIKDLKKATKYDSTEELLRKFGGAPPSKTPSKQPGQSKKPSSPQNQPPHQRTGLPPPPTANIQGRQNITPPQQQSLPLQTNQQAPSPTKPISTHSAAVLAQSPVDISPDSPGFAPNAFPSTTYSQNTQSHWYDRLLDVLLGDDETAAKNRIVLLCGNCRLVNGQAPPGVRTLEELGKWKCSGCGAWNGVESEATKTMKEIAASTSKVENGEDWEKVPRATELEEQPEEDDADVGSTKLGTTGREEDNNSGMTKRVTRSAGKVVDESLE
jgi:endoplasmic reticulum junction formation protein lunapark